MKENKFLYETIVQKQIEEKVSETEERDGQKVEIVKTVKKTKPIKIGVLKPNRRLFEAAEIYYAKTINEMLKAGLLPYSLVAKRYANDGGPLSEPEKNEIDKLKVQAEELESKYYDLATSTEPTAVEEKKQIILKLQKVNIAASKIQGAYADIFDNTAEVKAKNRLIDWWSLHLSYIDEDDKGLKPLFGDGVLDDRFAKYDDFEDVQDPFFVDVIKRLYYLVSFWLSARNSVKQLDFKGMEGIFQENISEYHPETAPEVQVNDLTPPKEKV